MIRAIPSRPDSIFLTFDDGPDEDNTEMVLNVLRNAGARATFFLIAEKIRGQEALVERIVRDGHAIGNHSWDHRYMNYFKNAETLRHWITSAGDEFRRLGLPEPVGFRPPAGVVTPKLKRVLRDLREPLVLWNERFYDRTWTWTHTKASRSAARLRGGSVVLLHDKRRVKPDMGFCRTLELYIDQLSKRGLKFESLSRPLCEGGIA